MKTDLYAMKTNQGYGFFQRYKVEYSKKASWFSIIYRTQVKNLKQFKKIFKGDYFYEMIDDHLPKSKYTAFIKDKQEIICLGEFTIPKQILPLNYARILYIDHGFSLKYTWNIVNFMGDNYFVMYNGQEGGFKCADGSVGYKKLTPEIIDLPVFGFKTLSELREQFDNNYHPRDYNDEYVIAQRKKARAEMTQEDKKAFKDEWKEKRDDF